MNTFNMSSFSEGKTMVKPALALVALVMSLVAFSGEPDLMKGRYSNPLQLDVSADANLSDKLAAAGIVTLDDLNAYDAIVKTGAGVLTADGSLIAGFAGEIHIMKGSWCATGNGHLGTADGKTYVHGTGADLVLNVPASTSFTGEEIVFYGQGIRHGYDGQGAIYVKTTTNYGNNAPFGTKWTLAGDALVQMTATNPYLSAIDVDFNGHTLTVWNGPYGRSSNPTNLAQFKSYADPGNLVLSNGVMCSVNTTVGTAKNSVVYRSSRVRIDGFWKTPWTFVVEPDMTIQATKWSASDSSAKGLIGWAGPMLLNADVPIADNSSTYPGKFSFTLTNVVSGVGGIRVKSNNLTLHLDNPANTFRGGVTVPGGSVLKLYANGSLPADGDALVMTNAVVVFDATTNYSLPDLTVSGTGLVSQAKGTWKQVAKVGEGTLVWDSLLSANELFVDGGTVKLPKSQYKTSDYCGFDMYITDSMTGEKTFEQIKRTGTRTPKSSFWKQDGVVGHAPSHLVNNIASNTAIPDGGAVGYEGWVWCDGIDGTEWTFVVCYGDANKFYLKIGDEILWNFDNPSGYITDVSKMPRKNVKMKHGWNHFEGAALKGWTGTSSRDGTWPSGHAFKVDRQGRATSDYRDYEFLFDAGDGTTLCSQLDDGISFQPAFPSVRLGSGVLDLNDLDYTFGWMRGTGSTVNGNVTVTGGWRLDCAETTFAEWHPARVNGKLTFGGDAKIRIENPSAWPKDYDITFLTADELIETLPAVEVPDGWNRPVKATLSADGRSVLLSCHSGLVLIFR